MLLELDPTPEVEELETQLKRTPNLQPQKVIPPIVSNIHFYSNSNPNSNFSFNFNSISNSNVTQMNQNYNIPIESILCDDNLYTSHPITNISECPCNTPQASPITDKSKIEANKILSGKTPKAKAKPNFVMGKVLNVNGLAGKLNRGILDYEMSGSDFCVFLETNTDEPESFLSNSILCDFKSFAKKKPDKTSSNYHYGGIHGICVLLNERFDLKYCTKFDNTVSECILWLRLKIQSFEFILGAVYIPCIGTLFYDEIWDQIYDDVGYLKQYNLPFLILGDENAHTGTLIDYIENDPFVAEYTGCIVLDNEENQIELFKSNPHCTAHRYNQEKIAINSTGRKAISFCITENFKIINGRFGSDKFLGRPTCFKGQPSVTDQALACDKMFKRITDFHVDLFDPNMSDYHAPFSITFDISDITPINEILDESDVDSDSYQNAPSMKFTWNNDLKSEFKSAADKLDTDLLLTMLDELVLYPSQEKTNQLCDKLNDMILDVAKSCKVYKEHSPKNPKRPPTSKRPPRKPWEDEEFCKARNEYKTHKNRLKRIGAKSVCNKKAKDFMKFGKAKQKQYFDALNTKIRQLKKNNSREYWLLLQNSIESKRTASKITLQTFLEHFRQLNQANQEPRDPPPPDGLDENETEILNLEFTLEEIQTIISHLKNNKTPGLDLLRNEFLKNAPKELVNFICRLFNFILNTSLIPDVWCQGLIMPLYKNKGDSKDPDNYRGITLLSCLGKLFTACISSRISKFMDVDYKLGPEQAGFREAFSTTDHIFTLYSIIDFYTNKKRRVYCAFVDYSKAFDLIERSSLWMKLLSNGINGKILDVMKSMYSNAKSCVKLNGKISEYFSCCKGVRQGENLSPVLFAIYLNDFHDFLSERCVGLNDLCSIIDEELDIYLKLYVLLYADDTIILAESEADLQNALSSLHDYCIRWDLKVNISKTNVVIFSRGKVKKHGIFKIGEEVVEVKEEYVYLGVTFSCDGRFKKAIEKQVTQSRKAMYALIHKAKILRLPADIVFELYEHCVIPVLLYGSEIWGFENLHRLEIFHRQFFKLILKTFKFTPDCMIYGETNSIDIRTKVDIRMVNFWLKLKSSKVKISVIMNSLLNKIYEDNDGQKLKWPAKIKNILEDTGLSYLWHVQVADYLDSKSQIKSKCHKLFLDRWTEAVRSNSQCDFYRLIKSQPKLENFLIDLSYSLRIDTTKFFIRGHHLPVTLDRWNQGSSVDRKCKKCNQNVIGDENHYVFDCSFFTQERSKYLPNFTDGAGDLHKAWEEILSYRNSDLVNFAKFVRIIMANFEYDKKDNSDKDNTNDWLKIKRAKTSKSGRILKLPARFQNIC